jgi:hypothetical protein
MFTYNLPEVKTMPQATSIETIAIFTGANEVGSTRLGTTPGGGGPAGTRQRSVGAVAVMVSSAFQKLNKNDDSNFGYG